MKITLKSLYLQNFATFSNQTIHFEHGLNIIMGETGSGKSLILDALLLILGGKADRKFIRAQTSSATVESIFEIEAGKDFELVKTYFDELGLPCEDNEISIKRIIYQNEKAKIFLNGQVCGLGILQKFSKDFVDVVGQFENQKLLQPEYQLQIIDYFLPNRNILNSYLTSYQDYISQKSQLAEFEQKQQMKQERESFLRYLVDEYDRVAPSEADEENFLKLKTERSQWEEKSLFLNSFKELVSSETPGSNPLLDQLKQLKSLLMKGKKFYQESDITNILDNLYLLENQLDELVSRPHEEINEESFQLALDKLDQFQKLKKKFGVTMKELPVKACEYKEELEALNDLEEQISKLKMRMDKTFKNLWDLGTELSLQRKLIAKDLSKKLSHAVESLNMQGAILRFVFTQKTSPSLQGIDDIKLMAKLNKGEGEHELIEIASGGELSRILLALRQISSQNQSVSIFLFDEIDTGIGGKTALLIGKSLKDVSKNSQVLAITHLPQVAAQAAHMIKVSKIVKKVDSIERTFSNADIVAHTQFRKEIELMAPIS